MDYRKHLEEKFRKYQAILADNADGEDKINLEEITKDFCEIDDWGLISIRHIPAKDNYVYFTVFKDETRNDSTDYTVSISQLCDGSLEYLVENMRKAMIIEELRNTYIEHETA